MTSLTPPARGRAGLGLPPTIDCCLFDLDGVLTRTADQHARAWKEMFDAFLMERAHDTGLPRESFSIADDYIPYVDGRSRRDGTRAFLASRAIFLPEGERDDGPEVHSVSGLSNRKNSLVLDLIAVEGVAVFEESVRYVEAVRAAGLPCAVVTSSANAEQVLAVTGLASLFDVRVDAHVAAAQDLAGKPAPDTYLAAARLLGHKAGQAAVFEDALAGVRSGRAGGFGLVVGVDRAGQGAQLRTAGAHLVVTELSELLEES